MPQGNGQYYLFQTRKRSQKLLKFIVKGHGYTLKTSIFAIFQKSAKKGGGGWDTVRCPPKWETKKVTDALINQLKVTDYSKGVKTVFQIYLKKTVITGQPTSKLWKSKAEQPKNNVRNCERNP